MSNNQDTQDESPARFAVTVALAANEVEVLEQLFFFGPTWDGNILSKAGRDQLFDLKLATRVEGYSFLTAAGVRLALQNRLEGKKEVKRRDEHKRLAMLNVIQELFVPPADQQQVHGLTPRPTVESLQEILSRPEPAAGKV